MAVPYEEMQQLVGRPFPGGTFTIERWENFLLHDVFTAPEPSDGLAHPMYAFHGPLAAMGMTFAEFFELCRSRLAPDGVLAGALASIARKTSRPPARAPVTALGT